ncbi:hypothetical protein, partial [Methanospirillum sp.]
GTPIIVSPDITSSSIISEKGIGMVTRSYGETVLHIMEHYSDYLLQAEHGRRWVQEHLKWEYFCRQLYERCEAVLHN